MITMLQSASRLQTGQQGENASRAEGAGTHAINADDIEKNKLGEIWEYI